MIAVRRNYEVIKSVGNFAPCSSVSLLEVLTCRVRHQLDGTSEFDGQKNNFMVDST